MIKIVLIALLLISQSLMAAKNKTAEQNIEQIPPQGIIIKHTETQNLPSEVLSLIHKYKVNPDNISIYIRDINADKPLIAHNINVQRIPASTMKLLTTFAALKELGPSFRWKTEAWLRGKLKDGTLHGDLILKGYGDPFLVHEYYWKFIHDLYHKGLHTITGNIIIDNSYYDIPDIDPGAFDHKPHRTYNAPPSALMFNFQATRFLFEADKETKSVNITPFPKSPHINLLNQVKYMQGKCRKSHYKPKFSRNKEGDLVVKGSYATGCGQTFILRHVTKPEHLTFDAFKQFWTELGGHLHGNFVTGKVNKQQDKRFHIYRSPSLGEQIRFINKWSNNVMVRQVLLTLGAKKYGIPTTLKKGRDAIITVLKDAGIPNTEDILIENGSGLSRIAHFSAKQMARLLEIAYHDAYMPEFLASLSLLGRDGTLYKRFRNEDLAGRAHLKTGTINDVTAVSGYMLNRNDKRLIIVMLHNGKDVHGKGVALQNAILRWVFKQ